MEAGSRDGLTWRVLHRVLWVTLDRPGHLNAWTDAMYLAWARLLTDAGAADNVACVVVTGRGKKAFSAGQDVSEIRDWPSGSSGSPSFPAMFRAHAGFCKPLIAGVNGLAVGWGVTMLASCDFVLASDGARFRTPFTALGLAPEGGSSASLAMTMRTPADAAWSLLSSEWMDASQALASGLVWRVFPKNELERALQKTAGTLAQWPIASLIATKRLMVQSRYTALVAAMEREQLAFRALVGRPANVEAMAAMAEKRAPDFSNL
jgi:enoyl-CoA hydratase/carnithine racemase